ncbi:hypothetical protein GIB67_019911 [Kingdonia uniflora]|uniref:Uncharacterized protein n=1 Tax=Kingdonia uniflora TaxID=39325 RepID=A0A7J7MKD9_9MAGN|nr:hypothetical protein GIB67_019911 [Kingdonia uniflora]
MKEDIQLKRVLDEQYALAFADLPMQLDAKRKKNTSLEAELKQKSGLEDCNQSLSVELNKKCKESESLKVINALLMEQLDLQLPPATPCKKLVNAEERMKSLKVNNSEWEVWRQALKKALTYEGMRDMGNPTFKELFEQNERLFTSTTRTQRRLSRRLGFHGHYP